jgi:hypothetical protein
MKNIFKQNLKFGIFNSCLKKSFNNVFLFKRTCLFYSKKNEIVEEEFNNSIDEEIDTNLIRNVGFFIFSKQRYNRTYRCRKNSIF